ncbi:hypothetical protein GGR57DRAFT_504349 [Xylariaceae sp. FL1272]|nr:hypothetical protein GGR57DRAFT_504349 [Xylariaceae sp. FL1272]
MEGAELMASSSPFVPPSRQKNCNSCVQAKRRCDRRLPCSRCIEKKTSCTYNRKRPNYQPASARDGADLPAESPCYGETDSPVFNPSMLLDSQVEGSSSRESQAPTFHDIQQLPIDTSFDYPMDSFMELMNSSSLPAPDQWLIQRDTNDRPGTPADEEITKAYDKMAPFCDNATPWDIYDPTSPRQVSFLSYGSLELRVKLSSRANSQYIYYVVNRVKTFTNDMATRNATPFLHKNLYRNYAPACIVSCFSICVLYNNATSATTPMVMRALHHSRRELVATESGRTIATPTEKLARAQALFLYQVICLFDVSAIFATP